MMKDYIELFDDVVIGAMFAALALFMISSVLMMVEFNETILTQAMWHVSGAALLVSVAANQILTHLYNWMTEMEEVKEETES